MNWSAIQIAGDGCLLRTLKRDPVHRFLVLE